MIVGLVLLILSPIIAELIKLAVSRKREYLADASAILLTRYPEGLASALEKLRDSKPLNKASKATAHLFIVSPFGVEPLGRKASVEATASLRSGHATLRGAKARRGVSKLFATHPPIEDRIRVLREM